MTWKYEYRNADLSELAVPRLVGIVPVNSLNDSVTYLSIPTHIAEQQSGFTVAQQRRTSAALLQVVQGSQRARDASRETVGTKV